MVIVFPEDSALAARHSDSMSATGGGREATRSPDQSRRNSAPWEEFQPSVADKEKQQASLAQDGRIVVSMTWENARVLEGELPDIELGRWRVLFQTHEMAVAAVDTLRESLGNKIAVWYNSTPLDERGWPIFESKWRHTYPLMLLQQCAGVTTLLPFLLTSCVRAPSCEQM